MPILALLIGATIVGVGIVTSRNKAAPPNAATLTATLGESDAGTRAPSDAQTAGSGQPANIEQGPDGQVYGTSDTGAQVQQGANPSPTSPPSFSTQASTGEAPPAPTMTVKSVNHQLGFTAQYGTNSTKADQSTYYSTQAAGGNILY